MELVKGNSRPLIVGVASGALFAVLCVAASCAPAPERVAPPKSEAASKPALGRPSGASARAASFPVPITIRVPRGSSGGAVAGRVDARESLTQPGKRAAKRPMKLTQIKSLEDVLAESYSPSPVLTEKPAAEAPKTEPAQTAAAETKESEPKSSLRHPAPALPIPEGARLEAGRSASSESGYGDRPAPIPQEALDKSARAQLNLPNDEALEAQAQQRSVILEASFLGLVLLCIVGAMWYRMSSNFGVQRPRRYDWDK